MNVKEKKKVHFEQSDHIDGYKSTVLQRWGMKERKGHDINNRKKESMFILDVQRWVEGEF